MRAIVLARVKAQFCHIIELAKMSPKRRRHRHTSSQIIVWHHISPRRYSDRKSMTSSCLGCSQRKRENLGRLGRSSINSPGRRNCPTTTRHFDSPMLLSARRPQSSIAIGTVGQRRRAWRRTRPSPHLLGLGWDYSSSRPRHALFLSRIPGREEGKAVASLARVALFAPAVLWGYPPPLRERCIFLRGATIIIW